MDNLKKIKGEIYFRITVIEYFNLISFIRMYLFLPIAIEFHENTGPIIQHTFYF